MKIGEFRAAVDSLNWNRRDLSGATRQEFVAMDVRTRLERHIVIVSGVVVLCVQIGALCSENPLHDKHLRFRHFRALRTFRADWCASAPAAL